MGYEFESVDAAPADTGEGATGRLKDDEPAKAKTKAKDTGDVRDKRRTKDVVDWNSYELAKELADRTIVATRSVNQTDRKKTAILFAKWRKEGIDSRQIVAAMDSFFADRRNLADTGEGHEVWRRFIYFFKTNQKTTARKAGLSKTQTQVLAEQIDDTVTGDTVAVSLTGKAMSWE